MNAVAHRDYADRGRRVEVCLYDDRMEITSPGAPVPPVTVEDLRRRAGIHASRNPLIARVLVELGLMREEGEGIPRMFDEMQRSFLRPPELDVTDDGRFVVTLRNPPIFESADEMWGHLLQGLTTNPAHRRVLLAHPGGFTNEQYREVNDVDRDEAYRQITEMVSSGLQTRARAAPAGAPSTASRQTFWRPGRGSSVVFRRCGARPSPDGPRAQAAPTWRSRVSRSK